MRFFSILVVMLFASACPQTTAGTLRPLLEELFLPAALSSCRPENAQAICGNADQCSRPVGGDLLCEEPSTQTVGAFSVRNIGGTTVTITSVSFEASTVAGGSENFSGALFDETELPPDGVSSLRFDYNTPDIFTPIAATLVVVSTADNARLEVPVSTLAFVEESSEGEGEGE